MELNIVNVSKNYTDKKAVDEVSLCMTPGIWGLLGANGAGKTTLMRMVADIIKPTSGKIFLDGIDICTLDSAYRDLFGYLPQDFGFYPEFSVQDYLEYVAALKGLKKKDTMERIDFLLEKLSLSDVRKKKIRKLSGGMRRRVGIAQALLNDPKILILDEPTAGLDPGERIRFRKILAELSNDRIILISTHIVPDVEYVASKQAIMKEGKIIAIGTTEELVEQIKGKVWKAFISVDDVAKHETTLQIVNMKNDNDNIVEIRYLSDNAILPDSEEVFPRLEDLYLWLFPAREE